MGRRPEVATWGWSEAEQAAFLDQQARVRESAYAMQFPGAEDEIVEVEGKPAGRRLVQRGNVLISLIDLALLPHHRGHGIGRVMVEQLVSEARARGCPLRLEVARDNPAQRLYARAGLLAAGGDELHLVMEWRP